MADSNIVALRKKEGRGILLTIMLVIISTITLYFVSFFIIGSFVTHGIPITQLIKHLGIEYMLIYFAIPLFSIISTYAIWKWSRKGVYLGIVLFGILILYYFTYRLPVDIKYAQSANIMPIITISQELWMFLLFSGLYLWAIIRKWHLFS